MLKTVLDMTLDCIWWWSSGSGFWRMCTTSSLSLLSDPLRQGVVVVPVSPIVGQIELSDHLLRINFWNRSTERKLFVF